MFTTAAPDLDVAVARPTVDDPRDALECFGSSPLVRTAAHNLGALVARSECHYVAGHAALRTMKGPIACTVQAGGSA